MPRSLVLSAALAFLIVPPAAPEPAGAGFTLEQVLSAPFPSDLVASSAGGAVAWVFDTRGARNVWIEAYRATADFLERNLKK